MTDKPLDKDILQSFRTLIEPLESQPLPCMSQAGQDVFAFDLESRQRLAESRAWLMTPEGEEVIRTLRTEAKKREPVEPIGEQDTWQPEQTELPPKENRKRERKQPKKSARKRNMIRKKKSKPTSGPSAQPTAKQQELADLAKRLKEQP